MITFRGHIAARCQAPGCPWEIEQLGGDAEEEQIRFRAGEHARTSGHAVDFWDGWGEAGYDPYEVIRG